MIDDAQIRSWAAEQGFQLDADLTRDERVRELIQDELDRQAQDFRPYERPRDCLLTDSPFTIENGLLTRASSSSAAPSRPSSRICSTRSMSAIARTPLAGRPVPERSRAARHRRRCDPAFAVPDGQRGRAASASARGRCGVTTQRLRSGTRSARPRDREESDHHEWRRPGRHGGISCMTARDMNGKTS